jgi:TonB family protein
MLSSKHLVVGCLFWAAAPLYAQLPPAERPADSAEADSAAAESQTPVAAPAEAAPEQVAADGAQSASADSWFETRLAIMELAEAGDYEAALALGPRLLELAEAEFGLDSAGLAQVHLFLASVHQDSGDYLAAEDSIIAAIGIYERAEGPLSITLIEPYLDLGDNYDEAGDYASAITAYNEARTIGRRAYGLLNEDQLRIIDRISDAAVKRGDFDEANGFQVEALTLIERTYGEFSVQAIEARYKYAAWLRERNRFPEERQQYHQILRIAERHFEDEPLMRVKALRERANSFRAERLGDNLGLSGLREGLRIVRDLPEPDPLAHAEVMRDIGDWDVAFSSVGSISEEYVEAWRLLGQAENGEEIRRQWFDDLAIVYLAPLSPRGLSADPAAPRGRVLVRFTVDTSGRSSDVMIAGSDPPGFKDEAAVRQVRSSRFRPRIVNGELTTARRALAIDFRYEPGAVDPSAGQEASVEPEEEANDLEEPDDR